MLHLILSALMFVEASKDVDSSPLREDGKASQEDWFIKVVNYMKSSPETVEELMTKKHAVVEGDLLLPKNRNAVESVWPTREIPFVISSELANQREDILSAMAMVSQHSCVSFHQRTSENSYLHYVSSRGCASYVGFIGGEQTLFVGPMCIVGNIVHEILHALGFHHEHTRMDREQFIKVLSHNIMEGKETNFEKQRGQTFDLRYDVTSIMHYGSGFFSVNSLPTIVAYANMEDMGQRHKMTETDMARVRLLYSCDFPKSETESSVVVEEEEEDENAHVLIHDVTKKKTSSNNKQDEGQTSAPPLHL
ncbi:astacin-like metalloendopeptidase [Anoplopoma fimbria]|uniref:astacin-like metalloendopeptidase n=1 Tax=Anoplopoma fimbria TaxID=229290 RepID=UPI0023EDFD90|nr:astacin-like metalloendopeptidase [Anoplopoma fimbria]